MIFVPTATACSVNCDLQEKLPQEGGLEQGNNNKASVRDGDERLV